MGDSKRHVGSSASVALSSNAGNALCQGQVAKRQVNLAKLNNNRRNRISNKKAMLCAFSSADDILENAFEHIAPWFHYSDKESISSL